MSINICPCDNNFCQEKQLRFIAWQRIIAQSDGVGFRINPDTLSGCPNTKCPRYRRSVILEIINHYDDER